MDGTVENLIITAASESYRAQLLSFLGSLQCNWPEHPPVTVYDLGLSGETKKILQDAGFEVRLIPPFVPHWRKHYTWKLWCMNDASAERVLWLDAGCCVLRPLPEIFDIIAHQGYFLLPNHFPLSLEASEQACAGCGVDPSIRDGKQTITSAVFGFRRGSAVEHCVHESLAIARTERYIMATEPHHRWEQALLSLLIYRDIDPLVLCDGITYFYENHRGPAKHHAIWAARKGMHWKDKRFFASCLSGNCSPHMPRRSHKTEFWYVAARSIKQVCMRLTGMNRPRRFEGVR
jgi:hypothetical protein